MYFKATLDCVLDILEHVIYTCMNKYFIFENKEFFLPISRVAFHIGSNYWFLLRGERRFLGDFFFFFQLKKQNCI